MKNLKGQLVDFIGKERTRIHSDLLNEEGKAKPREKMIFALKMIGHNLAMLQNRVLDNNFED